MFAAHTSVVQGELSPARLAFIKEIRDLSIHAGSPGLHHNSATMIQIMKFQASQHMCDASQAVDSSATIHLFLILRSPKENKGLNRDQIRGDDRGKHIEVWRASGRESRVPGANEVPQLQNIRLSYFLVCSCRQTLNVSGSRMSNWDIGYRPPLNQLHLFELLYQQGLVALLAIYHNIVGD